MNEVRKAELVAAVQRGVELLDRKRPNWRERINLSHLDMSSLHNCVLGQLTGFVFSDEADRIMEGEGQSGYIRSKHGFDIPCKKAEGMRMSDVEEYAVLDEEWRKAISCPAA